MAKYILVFSFFILYNLTLQGQSQIRAADSLEIAYKAISFGSDDYKASLSNHSFCQAEDGLIYVGNLNGLLEFDGSDWRLLPLPAYSLVSGMYYQKSSDRIYVGSTNDFGYFEKDSLGVRHYHSMRHLVALDKRIPDVYQIIEIDGNLYFISIDLILKWDGTDVKIIPIRESYFIKLGDQLFVSLLNKGVAIFENDSISFVNTSLKFELDQVFGETLLYDDTYLLGTYGNGLYTFNTKTHQSQAWSTPAGDYAASKYIADLRPWRDSLLLIGTFEGGLVVSNKKGDVLNILDEKKGLSSNYLSYIHKDKRDNLWILTYYGIDVIRLNENTVISEDIQPEIRFISVNQQEIPASLVDNIPASPSDIVFHYFVPGTFSDDLEYSSYLQGYEKDWSGWSKEIKKEYKGVESGKYVFQIKARSLNGNVSKIATKSISIPLPWHKSIYTYMAVLLLIVLLIFITSRVLTLRLKKHNRNLEKLVKDRTVKLVEANKGLKLINAELDNFVYRSSHDLVAPLKSLKGLIHIAKVDTSTDNRAEYLDKMDSRVSKLEEFIKSIMEYSINSKQKINKVNVKLDSIVTSIVQDLKYYVKADKVRLIRSYDNETVLFTDEKRLSIILSNLITNALKYHNYNQSDPYIEVKVRQVGNNQTIEIIDNGSGIKREYLEKIFDMFFRASDSSAGSGLGLYIVKDMITNIGGNIDVQSEVGVGTTFTVVLPNT